MKQDYNFTQLEKNCQKEWEDKKIFSPDVKNAKNPYYNLMMFPYPSAEGLHVGNMYAFTGADIYAKFQRMQGKDVLEPIGLDGFGIHSENYAIKVGRHPKEQAQIAEKNYYRQLRSIGNSFDWQRTVETYDPDYYRWTQWLFVQMFKNGLAYRKKAQVNWCPSDKTVLSDEQVIDGKCERCSFLVEKRELEQWFFRITKYADRLIDNLSMIDWVEKVKIAQKQWIGKSEGAEIKFIIDNSQDSLTVFTTRPDTLYGATFMVIAPEHELVKQVANGKWPMDNIQEVKDYIEKTKSRNEVESRTKEKEKTGVFSGLYAINPVKSKKIPIWIADYVLSGYGTGSIMAVPAHDQRDFEFAKKYNLPIIPVVKDNSSNKENKELAAAFEGKGEIIGSEDWNGFHAAQDMSKILDSIEAKGIGIRGSHYHLRDWLISRQRYWGPPIPMIYCDTCFNSKKGEVKDMPGWYSVPEADLPVLLPDVEDWRPEGNGLSPLANHPEFFKTQCPQCGGEAKRETDVSDTFLDSAWYFLRYPSVEIRNPKSESRNKSDDLNISKYKQSDQNSEFRDPNLVLPWDPEITMRWLPVDMYIGGAEHSVLHLLYARFVTMVLKDLNFIDFEEPFTRFFAHGLIIKDGAKMSKSKGNVVVPDEYIKKYGADALRTYLMFLGPYEAGGDFSDSGIEGVYKFLKRVWVLFYNTENSLDTPKGNSLKMMHKTVKKVTNDVSRLSYNTAIAALMEWYNFLNSKLHPKGTSYSIAAKVQSEKLSSEEVETYLQLLAPFAPHMTEELWQKIVCGAQGRAFRSIHLSKWPEFDEKLTQDEQIVIAVQVNGKRRAEVAIQSLEITDQNQIERLGKAKVKHHLEKKDIKKVIYITGKILNFVVVKV